MKSAVEYVDPGLPHPIREVRVDRAGIVTIDDSTFGTLTRDVTQPTSREWVLTAATSGAVTHHPSKSSALYAAGRA